MDRPNTPPPSTLTVPAPAWALATTILALLVSGCGGDVTPLAPAGAENDLRVAGNTLHGYAPPALSIVAEDGGTRVCAAWSDARLQEGGFRTDFFSFDFELRGPGSGDAQWRSSGSVRGGADGSGACLALTEDAVQQATSELDLEGAWLRVRGMARSGHGRTTTVHHTQYANATVRDLGEGNGSDPGDDPPNPDTETRTLLGSEGGTLALERGEGQAGAALEVPAGALHADTEIGISAQPDGASSPLSLVLPGTTVFLSPSGQHFDVPVRLTLTYDPAALPPGADPMQVAVARVEADGSLTPLPSQVDPAAGTVSTELEGFSRYAAVLRRGGTLQVTTTTDLAEGGCTPESCSLRQALEAAANAGGSAVRIEMGEGTLVLSAPLPPVTGEVTLAGPGAEVAVVDAAATESARRSVLRVEGTGRLELSGLTLRGGWAAVEQESPHVSRGGAIRVLDQGGLVLRDMVLEGNRAHSGGGISFESTGDLLLERVALVRNTVDGPQQPRGGGLNVTAEATSAVLLDVRFEENESSALGAGAFIAAREGGVRIMQGGAFVGGRAGTGGGAYLTGSGSVEMHGVDVSGNVAEGNGGGLVAGAGTHLLITGSTLSGNIAGSTGTLNGGGGIWHIGAGLPGHLHLVNVTISGNRARNGGGLMSSSGNLTILNASFVGNETLDSASNEGGGGIMVRAAATIQLSIGNTLLAGNLRNGVPENCRVTDLFGAPRSDASAGGNVSDDLSCAETLTEAFGDLTGVDAGVSFLLADHGGPTLTHALLSGSAAIDAGVPGTCPTTDQRGFQWGGNCDAGSFAFGGEATTGSGATFGASRGSEAAGGG